MNTTRIGIVAASALALAAPVLAAWPADAHADKVRRGGCTGSTHWKVKAGHDDGRIEFEGEIDSNHNGQTWHWRLRHNGSVSARGTATTHRPSGSFEVHRRVVNLKGTDTLVFRAKNRHSGEACRGRIRL